MEVWDAKMLIVPIGNLSSAARGLVGGAPGSPGYLSLLGFVYSLRLNVARTFACHIIIQSCHTYLLFHVFKKWRR